MTREQAAKWANEIKALAEGKVIEQRRRLLIETTGSYEARWSEWKPSADPYFATDDDYQCPDCHCRYPKPGSCPNCEAIGLDECDKHGTGPTLEYKPL